MEHSMGEKYNLKWHSHKSSLVNYVADHLSEEVLVDVILACEGKFIKAHKLILSACSTYFKELFQMHNVDKPLIIMNNVKYEELKSVIDFIYNGEIRVLDCELQGILTLGNNLKIKGLSSVREKIMDQKIDEMFQASNIEKTKEGVKRAEAKIDKNKGKIVTKTPVVHLKSKVPAVNNRRKSDISIENKTIDESPKIKKRRTTPKTIENNDANVSEDSIDELHSILPPLVPFPSPIEMDAESIKSEKPPEVGSTTAESPVKTPDSGGTAPSRPVSAFMIFANDWRKRLAVEHPNETNKQISVRLSNMWKNLSDETRETFYSAANKANDQKSKS